MNLLQNQLRASAHGRIEMKHNGLANLFLGIIYGSILTYIHTFVKIPDSVGLMVLAILGMFFLTCFLYDCVR